MNYFTSDRRFASRRRLLRVKAVKMELAFLISILGFCQAEWYLNSTHQQVCAAGETSSKASRSRVECAFNCYFVGESCVGFDFKNGLCDVLVELETSCGGKRAVFKRGLDTSGIRSTDGEISTTVETANAPQDSGSTPQPTQDSGGTSPPVQESAAPPPSTLTIDQINALCSNGTADPTPTMITDIKEYIDSHRLAIEDRVCTTNRMSLKIGNVLYTSTFVSDMNVDQADQFCKDENLGRIAAPQTKDETELLCVMLEQCTQLNEIITGHYARPRCDRDTNQHGIFDANGKFLFAIHKELWTGRHNVPDRRKNRLAVRFEGEGEHIQWRALRTPKRPFFCQQESE